MAEPDRKRQIHFLSLKTHQRQQGMKNINFFLSSSLDRIKIHINICDVLTDTSDAPIAQLDRASGYEPEGLRFES